NWTAKVLVSVVILLTCEPSHIRPVKTGNSNEGAEVGGSNRQNHAGGHKSKGISYEGYSPPRSSSCYSRGQLFDLLVNAHVRRARARAGRKENCSRRRGFVASS